jgi:hypothetical protein
MIIQKKAASLAFFGYFYCRIFKKEASDSMIPSDSSGFKMIVATKAQV